MCAQEDEDGRVEYGNFLLRAVPLIESMCSPILAKQRAAAAQRAKLVPVAVLGETGREAMTAKLHAVFRNYDSDGDGVLSRQEFSRCLRNADLKLEGPQIAALFAASDSNEVRRPRPASIAAHSLHPKAAAVLASKGRCCARVPRCPYRATAVRHAPARLACHPSPSPRHKCASAHTRAASTRGTLRP